jgi:hypothetical protein
VITRVLVVLWWLVPVALFVGLGVTMSDRDPCSVIVCGHSLPASDR